MTFEYELSRLVIEYRSAKDFYSRKLGELTDIEAQVPRMDPKIGHFTVQDIINYKEYQERVDNAKAAVESSSNEFAKIKQKLIKHIPKFFHNQPIYVQSKYRSFIIMMDKEGDLIFKR